MEPADVVVFNLYTTERTAKGIDRAAELGLDQQAVQLAVQVLTDLTCLYMLTDTRIIGVSNFGYELARACKPPNAAP